MRAASASDRSDIIDVVHRIALLADAREWNGVATCFASEEEVDYTSEFGGECKESRLQS
jgi:hypothetical protein